MQKRTNIFAEKRAISEQNSPESYQSQNQRLQQGRSRLNSNFNLTPDPQRDLVPPSKAPLFTQMPIYQQINTSKTIPNISVVGNNDLKKQVSSSFHNGAQQPSTTFSLDQNYSPKFQNKGNNQIKQTPYYKTSPRSASKGISRSCIKHGDEAVKRICSVPDCRCQMLVCGDCMYDDPDHIKQHQQRILLVQEFLEQIEREELNGKSKRQREGFIQQMKEEGMRNIQEIEKKSREYNFQRERQKDKIRDDAQFMINSFTKNIKEVESQLIEMISQQQIDAEKRFSTFREQTNLNLREAEKATFTSLKQYLEQQFLTNDDSIQVESIFRTARDEIFGSNRSSNNKAYLLPLKISKNEQNQVLFQKEILTINSLPLNTLSKNEINTKLQTIVQSLLGTSKDGTLITTVFQKEDNLLTNTISSNFVSFGQNSTKSHLQQPSLTVANSQLIQKDVIQNLLQGSAIREITEYDYNRDKNTIQVSDFYKRQNISGSDQKSEASSIVQNSPFKLQGQIQGIEYEDNSQIKRNHQIIKREHTPQKADIMEQDEIEHFYYNSQNPKPPENGHLKNSYYSQSKSSEGLKNQYSSQLNANPTDQNQNSSDKFRYSLITGGSPYQRKNENDHLPTISEINHSNSTNSVFTQYRYSNIQQSFSECEVMEDNRAARVRSATNQVCLSQLPKEIQLQDQQNPTCLQVLFEMLVACGDNRGIIKLYDIESKEIIGTRFAFQNVSVIGMTYLLNQNHYLCSCSSDSDSKIGDYIDVWNLQDEKQSFRIFLYQPQLDHSQIKIAGDKRNVPKTQRISALTKSPAPSCPQLISMQDQRNIALIRGKEIQMWDILTRSLSTTIVTQEIIQSVIALGKELNGLIAFSKSGRVQIYKLVYSPDLIHLQRAELIKQMDLNQPMQSALSLFHSKILIAAKKNVLIWDTSTFSLDNKIEPYKNSTQDNDEICDLLAIQNSNQLSILTSCKRDLCLLLQDTSATQGMKHHLKDFQFPKGQTSQRLLLAKNQHNELFVVGLNEKKSSLVSWKLFGDQK